MKEEYINAKHIAKKLKPGETIIIVTNDENDGTFRILRGLKKGYYSIEGITKEQLKSLYNVLKTEKDTAIWLEDIDFDGVMIERTDDLNITIKINTKSITFTPIEIKTLFKLLKQKI